MSIIPKKNGVASLLNLPSVLPQLNDAPTILRGRSLAEVQFAILSLLQRRVIPNIVVVASSKNDYRQLCNFCQLNDLPYQRLPFTAPWGRGHFTSQQTASFDRLETLVALAEPTPKLIITTLTALCQYTIEPQIWRQHTLKLQVDQDCDFDDLCATLNRLGYQLVEQVYQKGEFAVRGGIIDLFAIAQNSPCRIEFFGDAIASLRSYDLQSLRSQQKISDLTVYPIHEAVLDEQPKKELVQKLFDTLVNQPLPSEVVTNYTDNFRERYQLHELAIHLPLFRNDRVAIANYLPTSSVLFFPNSQEKSQNFHQEMLASLANRYQEDLTANRPTLAVDQHFVSKLLLDRYQVIDCLDTNDHAQPSYRLDGKLQIMDLALTSQLNVVRKLINEEFTVVLLGAFKSQLSRIANILNQEELSFTKVENFLHYLEKPTQLTGVILALGTLDNTLFIEELQLFIIPDHVLLQSKKVQATDSRKISSEILSSFDDLKKNDLVVHNSHGIGKYCDTVVLDIDGSPHECMVISYRHNDKIYLPVDKFNTLQKYISCKEEDYQPKLDSLRKRNFRERKEKASTKAKEVAGKLLANYAKRQMFKAKTVANPSEEYFRFEAHFPFSETNDQLQAIDDISGDLASATPMDRLICGDVGFGKTEVALRAAMRVVSDGGQVLVLAPTTILVMQHYRTFSERLTPHGVKVALVNRLLARSEITEINKQFDSGEINIIIGTHRLLSLALRTKNLALIIIDEEQKFGVGHKETIKTLRPQAHILTLSATPIPRTLHMSLIGLKDISMISEPPQDRLAVKTYVTGYDPRLLQQAINYEIGRQGQVYYVHNRIADIHQIAERLRQLIPLAKIVVAHGRLPKFELEQAIVDFLEQKFNILLCTTIIESGIDMPNVNTLIVERADCFGLAQLYQLRGRVGRSHRQAHAYFLTDNTRTHTEEASKRLQALATHYELGSGFKIAHKDLEIRGAGNLMGSEQSGSIAAVGLDMFTSMVTKEIKKLQGNSQEANDDELDPEIKLPISAVIPRNYVTNENQRLKLYKRIFSASLDELHDVIAETEDVYGHPPQEIYLLIDTAQVKRYLLAIRALRLQFYPQGFFQIKLHSQSPLTGSTLEKGDLLLSGDHLTILSPPEFNNSPRQMLRRLNNNLQTLMSIVKAKDSPTNSSPQSLLRKNKKTYRSPDKL